MDREADGHEQISVSARETCKIPLELSTTHEDKNEEDNSDQENLDKDPNFQEKVVDESIKIKKVNELLLELGEPLLK